MLTRSLVPYSWDNLRGFAKYCECFSFTYLARYNTQAIAARVLQSFGQAWGPTFMNVYPRVNGGRPGFAVATWAGPTPRFLVAVEGMTSLPQLAPVLTGFGAVSANPLDGHVFGAFRTWGNDILQFVGGIPQVQTIQADPNHRAMFTGFSLGAACAEVMNSTYRRLWGSEIQSKCVKFACPRVGTAAWDASRWNLSEVVGFYVGDDPINFIPYITNYSTRTLREQVTDPFPLVSYAPQGGTRLNIRGFPRTSLGVNDAIGSAFAMSSLALPMGPTNPWYWHEYNAYRYALTYYISQFNNYDVEYRFRWLEFNDDNSWGTRFFQHGENFHDIPALLDPAPEPVAVRLPEPILIAQAARMAQPPVQPPPVNIQFLPAAPRAVPRNGWTPRRVRGTAP